MSKALSVSVTFEALAGRVTTLEQSPMFTGTAITLGDMNFGLLKPDSAQAILSFDATDGFNYNRSTNTLRLFIGGVAVLSINASGNLKTLGTITPSTTP